MTAPYSALGVLARYANDTAMQKGWYDSPRSFLESSALFHSEISEAVESYRDGECLDHIYYTDDGKPIGVPIELADLLIRVLDTCYHEGIPIASAMKIKMEYNKTREYRHGGKLA